MNLINTFNSGVSNRINKSGEMYKALIGDRDFTPAVTILDSADVNCGAVLNEFEYFKLKSYELIASLNIDNAEGSTLDDVLNALADIPRRGYFESDDTYLKRFKAIITQKTNPRRCTRWAILDAISYVLTDGTKIQLIEPFSAYNLYFQIRVEGTISYARTLFLDSPQQGFLDINFIGGPGIGEVVTYLSEILQRVKAAGVDYDVLFVQQYSLTKTSDAFIGTVQKYSSSDATILRLETITKTSDATITT